MIFLLLAAAIAGIMTLAFSILPSSSFLALPDAVYTSIGTVSGWMSWGAGLFGPTIKTAIVTATLSYVAIMIAFFLWDVIRTFTFPIINHFLHH